MRQGKILEIIETKKLNLQFDHNNNNTYKIKNIPELRESILELSKIQTLSSQANNLLGQLPFVRIGESINLGSNVFEKLNTDFQLLVHRVNILREVLLQSVHPAEKGTFFLKLPPTHNLSELIEKSKLLEHSFDQIFGALKSKESIKLGGFDVGTEWLIFVVGPAAVSFFAGTMVAAMKVAQEAMRTKILYNQFEASNQDAERRKKIHEAMNILLDNVVTIEAKKIVETYKTTNALDGDEVVRVGGALKELSSLFMEGANVEVPLITQNQIKSDPKDIELNINEESSKLLEAQKEILQIEHHPKKE